MQDALARHGRAPEPRPCAGPGRLDVEFAPADAILFRSESLCVLDFQCDPSHPRFAGIGPLRYACLFFPRRQCEIHVEGQAPFVSDQTGVFFLPAGTSYRRRAIDPLGERATVICIDPELLRQMLEDLHRRRGSCAAAILPNVWSHVGLAIHNESIALSTRLARRSIDPQTAEASIIGLVLRALACAGTDATRGVDADARIATAHGELVVRVKKYIRENIDQRLGLSHLAAHVEVSPFHLCRLFRLATGQTVYQYQLQIRLAAALEMLPAYKGHLAALAMDLGFSSHSHFATLFKREYGFSPGAREAHRCRSIEAS
jgi:AraC family transcriptional regulator